MKMVKKNKDREERTTKLNEIVRSGRPCKHKNQIRLGKNYLNENMGVAKFTEHANACGRSPSAVLVRTLAEHRL